MKNSGMIGWLTLNRVIRRWKRDEKYYTESHKSSKKFMKNLLKFKQIKKKIIKDVWTIFKSEIYFAIDNEILNDIRTLYENVSYYKPIKTKGAFNDNYIDFESYSDDRYQNPFLEGYLEEVLPQLT